MKRVLVLNDWSASGHVGCVLVMRGLVDHCRRAGMTVTATACLGRRFQNAVRTGLRHCDLVIVNGEGTMHDDAAGALELTEAALLATRRRKPVALVNTVWQRNRRANALLHCAAIVAARETLSAEQVAGVRSDVQVVPDLVISCEQPALWADPDEGPPAPVLVIDSVRPQAAELLARYASSRAFQYLAMSPGRSARSVVRSLATRLGWREWNGARALLPSVQRIARSEVVVTGRYHGACLAIAAGRPFVALSSNTHKTEGLLRDAALGDGAQLLTDTELTGEALGKIDRALERVRSAAFSPSARRAYTEACLAYMASAAPRTAQLFRAIAALA